MGKWMLVCKPSVTEYFVTVFTSWCETHFSIFATQIESIRPRYLTFFNIFCGWVATCYLLSGNSKREVHDWKFRFCEKITQNCFTIVSLLGPCSILCVNLKMWTRLTTCNAWLPYWGDMITISFLRNGSGVVAADGSTTLSFLLKSLHYHKGIKGIGLSLKCLCGSVQASWQASSDVLQFPLHHLQAISR